MLGRKPENINVRPGAGVPASGGLQPESASAGGRGGGGGGEGGGRGGGRGAPGAPAFPATRSTGRRTSRGIAPKTLHVADGHGGNDRIAKFNKDGDFLKSWGQTGSAQGQFNQIRGIASDAAGNIYVADAGNNRIQVFDGEGAFVADHQHRDAPGYLRLRRRHTVLCIAPTRTIPSMDHGEIYKVQLNGQIVGKFGKAGKLPGEFGIVDAIDCRTENDLWVGEIRNWRAQKVTLRR